MYDSRTHEFYLIKEVAKKLRVSPKTVSRLIEAGELKAHRVGGQIRITIAAYDDYIKSSEIVPDGDGS